MAPKANYAQKSPTIVQQVKSKTAQMDWFIIINRIENIKFTITQADHFTVHQGNFPLVSAHQNSS